MSYFEMVSISISGLTLLAAFIALYYAARQLKGLKGQLNGLKEQQIAAYEINKADHDWNKRMAAQNALNEYSQSVLLGSIQKEFDYIDSKEAIPLKTIQEKLESNASLQIELHNLLNFYEGLARGVFQEIYDEEVIKSARRGAMIDTFTAFNSYIRNRRNISKNAWSDLQSIVSKWEAAENEKTHRKPTHASIN